MSQPRILIAFYSTYGTNHQVAKVAAEAASSAGADVRLVRFAETAPDEVVQSQDKWREQLDKVQGIPEISHDDMVWADGYFFSTPTRYGSAASQVRAFIDTLGSLWQAGDLADKTFTATTSAQNPHGGQESTLLELYKTVMHWGGILVPPGYTDDALYAAGGNPYGFSTDAGSFGDEGRAAVAHQAKRLVEVTAKLGQRAS